MGYTAEEWRNRIAERSDISTTVTHLTRGIPNDGNHAHGFQVLLKILRERRIIGSTTQSGFICGRTPAVCFQDAPPQCLAQNVWYEQKFRKDNPSAKVRYLPFGLMFRKHYIYAKGGRPVIYDSRAEAKGYLPENQWWRIVHFDLSNSEKVIDWTHEREWRLPGDLEFELNEVTVVIAGDKVYGKFIEECRRLEQPDILAEIRGIVPLSPLLF